MLLPFISPRFLSVSSRCSGSSRRCRRFQTVGSAHLPGSETLAQVKATVLSPVLETLPQLSHLLVCWKRELSPHLGHPPRSKSASHLALGVDRVREQQEGQGVQEELGRERTHTGTLRQGCLEVPSQAWVWLDRGLLATWLLSPCGNICWASSLSAGCTEPHWCLRGEKTQLRDLPAWVSSKTGARAGFKAWWQTRLSQSGSLLPRW